MDVFATARQLGIDADFIDGRGQRHAIAPEALRALVEAMPRPDGGSPREPPAVTPAMTLPPAMAWQGRFSRAWLLAVQLYGVRSPRNWGIGDFTDLAGLIALAADWGADGVGLNPLHVLFAERPGDCSPYAPNSRLFLNPLYIDVEAVPECPATFAADHRAALQRARDSALVDYATVADLKWRALRAAFARFKATPDPARAAAFAAFRADGGALLRHFGCFEALRRRLRRPWWEWPAPWRRPDDAEWERLAAGEDADEVAFTAFMQWIADEQLRACRDRALACGMAVGLYLDVAVGVRPDGFDAWNEQGAISRHLSVGAPPDALNSAGQDWGLAGFHAAGLEGRDFAPFRAMLRAAMRHAGAIRLDHIMGLKRLYLIPRGFGPRDGAYVRMPFEALLSVVAQESAAARCVVIGEDLGTVPEGFRDAIAAWGVWSYRVMMFERDAHGFHGSDRYADNALVTFNTHDLATFAGWRDAGDLALKQSLGIDPGESREARREALRMLSDVLRGETIARDDFLGVLHFLSKTRARLLAVALDDLLAVADQPNVPGTVDQHPNWRRRLPLSLDAIATTIDRDELAQAIGERGSRSAASQPS